MSHQPFGHIYLEPAPVSHGSFWINAVREGFYAFCAEVQHVAIPVEDVTAGEAFRLQQRHDLLVQLNEPIRRTA